MRDENLSHYKHMDVFSVFTIYRQKNSSPPPLIMPTANAKLTNIQLDVCALQSFVVWLLPASQVLLNKCNIVRVCLRTSS